MMIQGGFASPEFVRRFQNEAESVASLQHPNIVAIYEVGEIEGLHYFSMDYIDGPSLAEVVREGPLPAERAARYVELVAEAIHHAHQRGILHRDLKPSNVLIDPFDQPRVTDFGLAKRLDHDLGPTFTGQVLGSPSYMPPEQAAGRHSLIGVASDVYSLGAILYYLLTGQAPFADGTAAEVLVRVQKEEPTPPRALNPEVPRDLETICLKCLRKQPAERYASAAELAADLRHWQKGEKIAARPRRVGGKLRSWCGEHPLAVFLAGLATLVIVELGFGGWWFMSRAHKSTNQEAVALPNVAQSTAVVAPRPVETPTVTPTSGTLRYGLYIHFDISTFAGYQWGKAPEFGRASPARFAPTQLDVRQWARVAKQAGMECAVLTAKHEAGFCLWPAADYDYSVAQSPVKTDVVAELIAACQAEGILPGVHYSVTDAHNEGEARAKGSVSAAYFELIKRQTADLHRQHPGLRIHIFDGDSRFSEAQYSELRQTLKRENPQCLLLATATNEYNGRRPGDADLPHQVGTVIQGWCWSPGAALTPLSKLRDGIAASSAKGQLYLLNVGPDRTSRIPDDQVNMVMMVRQTSDQMSPPLPVSVAPTSAASTTTSIGQRWTNSLGMIFVPVAGTAVQFSIWDTRVQDYQEFAVATGRAWEKPSFKQGPTHPAVEVSWVDAKAFCAWLTEKERKEGKINSEQSYRLPMDWEWSVAAGLKETQEETPEDKDWKIKDVYPWGSGWPPSRGAGNYDKSLQVDNYDYTSPVGSFAANSYGLYDMGGNVWQWCEDFFDGRSGSLVLRGASWYSGNSGKLLSSCRNVSAPSRRGSHIGFRCVLVGGTSAEGSQRLAPGLATRDHPWTNSLGMVFVDLPGASAFSNFKSDVLYAAWKASATPPPTIRSTATSYTITATGYGANSKYIGGQKINAARCNTIELDVTLNGPAAADKHLGPIVDLIDGDGTHYSYRWYGQTLGHHVLTMPIKSPTVVDKPGSVPGLDLTNLLHMRLSLDPGRYGAAGPYTISWNRLRLVGASSTPANP